MELSTFAVRNHVSKILDLRILFACLAISFAASPAAAGTFSGVVEAVSADDNTISVKLNGKKEEIKSFTFGPKAAVTLDGKKATTADIQEGQTITIVANAADVASKLTLKSPKAPATRKSNDSNDAGGNQPDAGFWPQHRGSKRDNISTETGLLDQWPAEGPKVAWEKTGLGEGYSSVSIANGILYTMGTQGNDEVVLAMNASDGTPIWSRKTGGRVFRDGQGNGPRGTPTIDDDRVYALGANGDLVCVGGARGDMVWHKNILEDYGGSNIIWGISESVLIDGPNLICSPGGKDATMVAIDKLTGREVWRCGVQESPSASYASPIVVDYQGDRMYVNYVHTAVIAVNAKDGRLLWGNAKSANPTANCSTPIFTDGYVFTASGYDTGGALFKLLKGGKAKLEYTTKEMVNHHGGMVLVDGYLYGFDEQILKCLDLKTGKVAWKNRSVGKGSLVCADGKLFLRSENGPVALCTVNPARYEEKGRFEPSNRGNRPAWSHPVVCNGRLFLRDMDSIVVYDVK